MTTVFHKAFRPVKTLLPAKVWQPLRQLGTALLTPLRFSVSTGHFRSSLHGKAFDRTGAPLPWYTYPAVDFLAPRNYAGKRVLEFGGGQSTLWWSERAQSVLTVDADAEWADYVRSKVATNVSVHHIPAEMETRSIERIREVIRQSGASTFDVIVIDGHLREELVSLGFELLAPSGALLFDNAEGYSFVEQLKGRSCRRVDFFGFAPGSSMRSCTSLIYVDDCFLINPGVPIPSMEST